MNNFPNSIYSEAAKNKLLLIDEYIAAHDLMIGEFYLKNNNPIAAIGRFENIINKYNYTKLYSVALYRMVQSHKMLGVNDEALYYKNILCNKFSTSSLCSKAKKYSNN